MNDVLDLCNVIVARQANTSNEIPSTTDTSRIDTALYKKVIIIKINIG